MQTLSSPWLMSYSLTFVAKRVSLGIQGVQPKLTVNNISGASAPLPPGSYTYNIDLADWVQNTLLLGVRTNSALYIISLIRL